MHGCKEGTRSWVRLSTAQRIRIGEVKSNFFNIFDLSRHPKVADHEEDGNASNTDVQIDVPNTVRCVQGSQGTESVQVRLTILVEHTRFWPF